MLNLRLLLLYLIFFTSILAFRFEGEGSEIALASDNPLVSRNSALVSSNTLQKGDLGSLLEKMPLLLGFERPMNYLILIQITDELRPSGGFLRAIIYARLEKGQPTQITAYDIQTLEPPGQGSFDWTAGGIRRLPPKPIERYMGLGNWVIRDANWWGDFRDSAEEVLGFWYRYSPEPVDGIIAVNDLALAQVVDAIGGIELANGEVIDGDNFKDYVISQFYRGNQSTWLENQRAIARELTEAFMNSIASLSRLQLLPIFGMMMGLLDSHDIMVFFVDPEIAATMNQLGFDGSLRTNGVSDYVYMVASNVSYSKSSPFIEHSLAYTATIDLQGNITSQFDVNIVNHYSRDQQLAFPEFYYSGMRWNPQTRSFYSNEGYYGEYTRIYLLPDAELTSTYGFDSSTEFPSDPTPLQVVGGYIGLESNEQKQVQIRWHQTQVNLDQASLLNVYIQRQPGAPISDVSIHITYPACAASSTERAEQDSEDFATASWNDRLETDREYTVNLENWSSCNILNEE